VRIRGVIDDDELIGSAVEARDDAGLAAVG
jgi:hypothetical protein